MTATPADRIQLIAAIKAHIAKGDKAAEKSNQHYIAAGRYLSQLKARHDEQGGTWDEWESLLRERVGIGKSRASELMAIADGTKTIEQVRKRTAESVRQSRAAQISPLRSGENADDAETSAVAPPEGATPLFVRKQDEPDDDNSTNGDPKTNFLNRAHQAAALAIRMPLDREMHRAAGDVIRAWEKVLANEVAGDDAMVVNVCLSAAVIKKIDKMAAAIDADRSTIVGMLVEHGLEHGPLELHPLRSLLIRALRGYRGRGRIGEIGSAILEDIKAQAAAYLVARKEAKVKAGRGHHRGRAHPSSIAEALSAPPSTFATSTTGTGSDARLDDRPCTALCSVLADFFSKDTHTRPP